MPFVYVHGVNNRQEDIDFRAGHTRREAFLKAIVAPAVGIASSSKVYSPYWGGDGVRFTHNLAVVPSIKGLDEALGVDAAPPSLGVLRAEPNVTVDSFNKLAKTNRALYIDLLFDFAATLPASEAQTVALADAYRAAQNYLKSDPTGSRWPDVPVKDMPAELVALLSAMKQPDGSTEIQGDPAGLFAKLSEAGGRLLGVIPRALSTATVAAARGPLTERLGRFVGDALVYLAERGNGDKAGPIAQLVLEQVIEAHAAAKERNEPLVVLSHSFGGEIMYDVLTHYANGSDLIVDHWVTIGSQVGLFEEMSLLWTSPDRGKAGLLDRREARIGPEHVKHWINIYDFNDIVSFTVTPVFTGAPDCKIEDYHYDTGRPVTGAHSGYFPWPSFYKRLAARLKGD